MTKLLRSVNPNGGVQCVKTSSHYTTRSSYYPINSTMVDLPWCINRHPQCPQVPIQTTTVCERVLHGQQSTTPSLLGSDSLNSSIMTSTHSQSNPVLLRTATTLVKNGTVARKANIFIAGGSSLSYITTKFLQRNCALNHMVSRLCRLTHLDCNLNQHLSSRFSQHHYHWRINHCRHSYQRCNCFSYWLQKLG